MKKRQLGPCVTFFPQPSTLIGTYEDSEHANLMMASWVGIVSKTPPTIAVSLHHNRKTYANILAQKAFSVNVVPASLAIEADACGLVSGSNLNKQELTKLEISPCPSVTAPLVNDAPLNVECTYTGQVELGDYRLVLGQIVEIHACDQAFGKNDKVDMYYWYYATYAMFQYGGHNWRKWNDAMKKAISDTQRVGGCADGSWDPVGKWGMVGGRIYATAINALTLEIYYRYAKIRDMDKISAAGK